MNVRHCRRLVLEVRGNGPVVTVHALVAAAIGANLPGASSQRCRTRDATDLMAVTPKAS